MRFSSLGISPARSLKNRSFIRKPHSFYKIGSLSLVAEHSGIFEGVYLILFKIFIKRLIKLRNIRFSKRKIWVWLNFNCPISRKSKNARMGKGVGVFSRWVMRFYKNHIFLQSVHLNFFHLYKFSKLFKSSTCISTKVIYTKFYKLSLCYICKTLSMLKFLLNLI